MLLPIYDIRIGYRFKDAEIGRKLSLNFALNELFLMIAVLNQILDRDDLHVVLAAELHQFGNAGHFPVFLDDFAYDRRGIAAA
ncbi:hypothetical protein D3C73_1437790 [compost metagenome]